MHVNVPQPHFGTLFLRVWQHKRKKEEGEPKDSVGDSSNPFSNIVVDGKPDVEPPEEPSEEEWDKTINVNLKSVFLGCKTFLPDMREQKNGSIINISSIAGLVGLSNCSAYNASKGGVRLLTKNIAVEYGDFNVRCNSIHPGFMATNMNDPKVIAERGRDINALTDAIPLKRMGTAEDIANCALFLASDESVYVTGSEYTVDAGLTAK